MGHTIPRLQVRLAIITALSFTLMTFAGYSVAIFFDMIEPVQLFTDVAGGILFSASAVLLLWLTWYHFWFLKPIAAWHAEHPYGSSLPESLSRHLKSFSSGYWSFYLLHVLAISTLLHWLGLHTATSSMSDSLLQFMLLQLVIAVLVGMPGYLLALTILGQLNRHIGVSEVQLSVHTKMLLIGGYVPLLTTTILLKYYWWRTGYVSGEIVLAWGLLGLIGFTISTIAIISLKQSLLPVRNMIDSNGALTHADIAKQVRPRSMDEIGNLVKMLGQMFRRLVEQKSQVSSVIDHAADGIIVLDADCAIEAMNPAAERIFGYCLQELRGKPLSWLIPEVDVSFVQSEEWECELEVEGHDRTSQPIPLSLRISRMQRNEQLYYTCLVTDISERKAAERKLTEAEARYRNLVETAHDLVWSLDSMGRWTYLNQAVTGIYGYEPQEMIGCPFKEFQAPESAQRDEEAFAKVIRGNELLQYETVHLDKQGKQRYISFNARPMFDENAQVIAITGTARDITEQKRYEHELTYQAQHDTLTGLYNRSYFQGELERVVSRVARSAAECALLYLDLDQFKCVNDTLGHAAGDRLLIECTELLNKNIREGDLLARFGGDEFTILLYNISRNDVLSVAEHIRQMFERYRFIEQGQTFNVTCSIGVAIIDSEIQSSQDALAQADLACNISKTEGRNCVHLYSAGDSERAAMAEDMGWVARVHDAIENNRFELLYQPIFTIQSGHVHSYEVLLRLPTDDGKQIMPGGFIPAAERFGLINNIDRWTVERAITQLSDINTDERNTRFSINLSGRAIEDKELMALIRGVLRDTRLDPNLLTFEITETAAITNLKAASRFLSQLKDIGCQLALDDFGSGFCSFTYLKHLPVDSIKIDGSFVQGLTHTNVDRAMVQSMNHIAHALNKRTVAEFVEDQRTLEILKDYGVDYAQGHYLGMPQKHLLTGVPVTGNNAEQVTA